jgi:hypothetical protein
MLTREGFRAWLEAYGRAWEGRDPGAAAGLFAEEATYQETPFDAPLRGRDAIRGYWAEVPRSQEAIRFGFDVAAVSGESGIALWRASFTRVPSGRRVDLDGVLLATFGADGLCESFREWWHRREA